MRTKMINNGILLKLLTVMIIVVLLVTLHHAAAVPDVVHLVQSEAAPASGLCRLSNAFYLLLFSSVSPCIDKIDTLSTGVTLVVQDVRLCHFYFAAGNAWVVV